MAQQNFSKTLKLSKIKFYIKPREVEKKEPA